MKKKKQYLDPAAAAKQIVDLALQKNYGEAEELLGKGARLDYLVKTDAPTGDKQTQRSAFHGILESGDEEALAWAAARGASPNVPMENGITPLHWCVHNDQPGTLQKLLGLGFRSSLDLNKRCQAGETPTDLAIRLNRVNMAAMLLKAGAAHDLHALGYGADGNFTHVQHACQTGDVELLQTLLNLGVTPYQWTAEGETLVHLATRERRWAVLDVLLGKRVGIGSHDAFGDTPLSAEMKRALTDPRLPAALAAASQIYAAASAADAPPEKGGDKKKDAKKQGGQQASNAEEKAAALLGPTVEIFEGITALLTKGAGAGLPDGEDTPVLYLAAAAGAGPVVQLLLETGAAPGAVTRCGDTAAHAAARLPSSEVLQRLCRTDPSVSKALDRNGNTPFHSACTSGSATCTAFLLNLTPQPDQNVRNSLGFTPLHLCARYGSENCAAVLLKRNDDLDEEPPPDEAQQQKGKKGADPPPEPKHRTEIEMEDGEGRTPLQVAMEYGWTGVVKLLVSGGANVKRGCLLHEAVQRGEVGIARVLLEGSAEVDRRDAEDNTPLHRAVLSGASASASVSLLLENGADPNARDEKEGTAPLHLAASRGLTEVAEGLLEHRALAELRDHSCRTPLHHAAEAEDGAGVAELLIRGGGNVAAVDDRLRTPLHAACASSSPGVVRLLLSHGASLSALDQLRRTPLHAAAAAGAIACTELLIGAGAVLNPLDTDHRTPLTTAAESHRVDVAKLLVASWKQREQTPTPC